MEALRRMRTFLARMLKRRRRCSSLEYLPGLVSAKILEEVIASTPDRRSIIAAVAERRGEREEELLARIAASMGYRFLSEIPPCDVRLLPANLKISNLRRSGAIVLTASDKIVGIACVDPLLVEMYIFQAGVLPRVLPLTIAPCAAIFRALDALEDAWLSLQKATQNEHSSLLAKVLERIVAQAQQHGARQAMITLAQTAIGYSFKTEDGRQGRGVIAESARNVLCTRFRGELKEESVMLAQYGRVQLTVKAQSVEDSGTLIAVAWNSPLQASPTLEAEHETLSSATKCDLPVETQMLSAAVLLVEDNPTFAKVAQRFLAAQGLVVIHADDGATGLKVLSTTDKQIGLIISDLHMPNLDGEELVRRVRADSRWNNLPIILLTSESGTEVELRLLAAGVDAFINKSDDPRILAAHARRLLERRCNKEVSKEAA